MSYLTMMSSTMDEEITKEDLQAMKDMIREIKHDPSLLYRLSSLPNDAAMNNHVDGGLSGLHSNNNNINNNTSISSSSYGGKIFVTDDDATEISSLGNSFSSDWISGGHNHPPWPPHHQYQSPPNNMPQGALTAGGIARTNFDADIALRMQSLQAKRSLNTQGSVGSGRGGIVQSHSGEEGGIRATTTTTTTNGSNFDLLPSLTSVNHERLGSERWIDNEDERVGRKSNFVQSAMSQDAMHKPHLETNGRRHPLGRNNSRMLALSEEESSKHDSVSPGGTKEGEFNTRQTAHQYNGVSYDPPENSRKSIAGQQRQRQSESVLESVERRGSAAYDHRRRHTLDEELSPPKYPQVPPQAKEGGDELDDRYDTPASTRNRTNTYTGTYDPPPLKQSRKSMSGQRQQQIKPPSPTLRPRGSRSRQRHQLGETRKIPGGDSNLGLTNGGSESAQRVLERPQSLSAKRSESAFAPQSERCEDRRRSTISDHSYPPHQNPSRGELPVIASSELNERGLRRSTVSNDSYEYPQDKNPSRGDPSNVAHVYGCNGRGAQSQTHRQPHQQRSLSTNNRNPAGCADSVLQSNQSSDPFAEPDFIIERSNRSSAQARQQQMKVARSYSANPRGNEIYDEPTSHSMKQISRPPPIDPELLIEKVLAKQRQQKVKRDDWALATHPGTGVSRDDSGHNHAHSLQHLPQNNQSQLQRLSNNMSPSKNRDEPSWQTSARSAQSGDLRHHASSPLNPEKIKQRFDPNILQRDELAALPHIRGQSSINEESEGSRSVISRLSSNFRRKISGGMNEVDYPHLNMPNFGTPSTSLCSISSPNLLLSDIKVKSERPASSNAADASNHMIDNDVSDSHNYVPYKKELKQVSKRIEFDIGSDRVPRLCDGRGRCLLHPHIRLQKPKLFGGWKVLFQHCPDCAVEHMKKTQENLSRLERKKKKKEDKERQHQKKKRIQEKYKEKHLNSSLNSNKLNDDPIIGKTVGDEYLTGHRQDSMEKKDSNRKEVRERPREEPRLELVPYMPVEPYIEPTQYESYRSENSEPITSHSNHTMDWHYDRKVNVDQTRNEKPREEKVIVGAPSESKKLRKKVHSEEYFNRDVDKIDSDGKGINQQQQQRQHQQDKKQDHQLQQDIKQIMAHSSIVQVTSQPPPTNEAIVPPQNEPKVTDQQPIADNEESKDILEDKTFKPKKVNGLPWSDYNGDSGRYTGEVNKKFLPHGEGEMVYDRGVISAGIWFNGVLDTEDSCSSLIVLTNASAPTPETLSGYSIGDIGRDEVMIIDSKKATAAAVAKIRANDAAFVRRSDGSWTYAIVKDRSFGSVPSIRFKVNARGSTKDFPETQWGTYVRRIKQRSSSNPRPAHAAVENEKLKARSKSTNSGPRTLNEHIGNNKPDDISGAKSVSGNLMRTHSSDLSVMSAHSAPLENRSLHRSHRSSENLTTAKMKPTRSRSKSRNRKKVTTLPLLFSSAMSVSEENDEGHDSNDKWETASGSGYRLRGLDP